QTMKLGVNPRGRNALITKDNLRADVLAQFYIKVQPDEEHILTAARSLGENSVNAEAVEALVSEKLVSALRAIASQMDLFEIHTKRDDFAERVKEHVKSDLEANGLLLESVTISELDQTDPAELSDNNVFDAQGKRKITEITAAAQVERNTLEREAERARNSSRRCRRRRSPATSSCRWPRWSGRRACRWRSGRSRSPSRSRRRRGPRRRRRPCAPRRSGSRPASRCRR